MDAQVLLSLLFWEDTLIYCNPRTCREKMKLGLTFQACLVALGPGDVMTVLHTSFTSSKRVIENSLREEHTQ